MNPQAICTFAVGKARLKLRAASVALTFIFLSLAGCGEAQEQKNVCPIDEQPPQWTGGKNGQSCEYLHYSDIERKAHSWWADCKYASKLQYDIPAINGQDHVKWFAVETRLVAEMGRSMLRPYGGMRCIVCGQSGVGARF